MEKTAPTISFYFLTILFIICFQFVGNAQNESFTNYTTKDGLPSSQVYDIIQDDYGYLWFSTDKGLSRYNGYEFENFSKNDGLSDNVIFDFHKRPNGDIWCTTNSTSLFYISGADPTFTPYEYNDYLIENYAHRITNGLRFSPNGDLYLAFHDCPEYLRISKNGKELAHPDDSATNIKFKPQYYLFGIMDDAQEPFFFTSKQKNAIVDIGSNTSAVSSGFKLEDYTMRTEVIYFQERKTMISLFNKRIIIRGEEGEYALAGTKEIIASGKLNDTQFWVGFRYGGVSIYNLKGEKQAEYMTDRSVTQLYIDNEGYPWISTLERGVFKIRNKSMNFLEPVGPLHIHSFCTDLDGLLYIGGYDGTVFKRMKNGTTELFYSPKVIHRPVDLVFDKNTNQIFFSSDSIFDGDKNSLGLHYVDYLSILGHHQVGFGNFKLNLYNTLNKETKVLFAGIRVKDAINFNHRIYVANISGLFSTSLNDPKHVVKNHLKGIRIDDLEIFNEHLVLGTNGDGLILLDKNLKMQFKITKKDGLSSDYLTKVYAENKSTLWVCTNNGINRIHFNFKEKKYTISKIDAADGLVSNEVWDILILKDTIWIGTQNGINYISKANFNNLHSKKINYFLQWKSIRVNDKPITDQTSFSYDQAKFEFTILGVSFGLEKGLEYRYKLNGLDKAWSYTKNRNITFSALAPGKYELVVMVKGKNRTWETNQINYSFTIHPPFWKTWWFISICILAFGALIYLFFKIRVLTYNKDVVREILRFILQKLRRNEPNILIRVNGKDIRVKTAEILFVKTSGNYLEIHLAGKSHLVRSSISKFMETLPDKIEFLQVHRSYIVRIDKVQQKGKDELIVGETAIPIGRVYLEQVKLIEI